jgi:hypothetical protein
LLKTYYQMKDWGAWSCAAWLPWAAVVWAMASVSYSAVASLILASSSPGGTTVSMPRMR